MDIVGKWSLDSLAPDHQDMVLVFLPDGRGVLEIYNWSLGWYETFNYSIQENSISIVGDKRYEDNLETKQIEETPSHIQYDGIIFVKQDVDAFGKQIDILEFEKPPIPSYFHEKHFGRVVFDVSRYRKPSLEEWRK